MNCPYHSTLTIGIDQAAVTAVFDGSLTASGTALSLLVGFARYVEELPAGVTSIINLDLSRAAEIDSYILPGFRALNDAAARTGIKVNVNAALQVASFLQTSGLPQLLFQS